MRPIPGATGNGPGSSGGSDALSATSTAPMACFITTEAALDATSDCGTGAQTHTTCTRRKRSFESTCASTRSRLPSPTPTWESIASLSSSADLELRPGTSQSHSPLVAPEAPVGLSGSASAISSASSRRNSMAASPSQRRSATPSTDGQSRREAAPQLIMPSLTVPQRRPFSDAGKSLGKLKVLVAGPSGIGKFSLIQSISYCCEHIVHMDPVVSTSTNEFSEMWASTRPRPWWRGDLDLAGSRKRRGSSVSEILDRNLCFVVRSALRRPSSRMAESNYVESQLLPILDKAIDDSDLWTLLSGGGVPIVDVVLYLIPHSGLGLCDIECIRALQEKTNVIPLLARSDELSDDTIWLSKQRIRHQLDEHELKCFSFTHPDSDTENMGVFSVSSATQADYDTMDASILMSSEYIQPLVATDLPKLVERIFSVDGSSWLRHSAATKCTQWRRERNPAFDLHTALTHRDPAKCALSPVLTVNPFAQRHYWGRVEASNWAQGLRQSLESERLHHVSQQRIVTEAQRNRRPQDLVKHRVKYKVRGDMEHEGNMTRQDPLGLLQIGGHLKRNGQMTFELLSSLGLIGCVATWLAGPEWAGQSGLRQLSRDLLGWKLLI